MDRALVVGDTGGIGAALSQALRVRGHQVTGLSRSRDGFDLADPESVAAGLAGLEPDFGIVLVATGVLGVPEKSLKALSADAMARQFAVNAVGPALVLRGLPRLLPRGRRAIVGVLSARVGSIEDNRLGGWYSYRAAKAALNQILKTAAIEIARTHPQAVLAALHPGTVETAFTAGHAANKVTPATAAGNLLSVLDGLTAADTGCFRDRSGADIPW
jgi:NAD(P)-dependent dehydrogenase (short-subunit alcohol dehydrogenase family)